MKPTDILVRPIISEKVNKQMEQEGKYSFVVGKAANKLEIKKAIEDFYGVKVASVNTAIMPSKSKTRFTKAGFLKGRKPSYKKAIIALEEGETIDIFGSN
ncbi:MAG: 50S ribosomal protein L23 [Chitinophagia bacterium]|nr:50S ribosomal protein L23 [Chitinophagia bacterium]